MSWGVVSAMASVAGFVAALLFRLNRIDQRQGERIAALETKVAALEARARTRTKAIRVDKFYEHEGNGTLY